MGARAATGSILAASLSASTTTLLLGVEISLAGQNLLNGRHLEFAPTYYVQPTEPGRAVQLKVTWAF